MRFRGKIVSALLATLMLLSTFFTVPSTAFAEAQVNPIVKANWEKLKTFLSKEPEQYYSYYLKEGGYGQIPCIDKVSMSLSENKVKFYVSFESETTDKEVRIREVDINTTGTVEGNIDYYYHNTSKYKSFMADYSVSLENCYSASDYTFSVTAGSASVKDIQGEFEFAAKKIEKHLLKPALNLTLEDLGFGVPAYSEDQKAVYTAYASITALKAADAMTLADKDAVTAARAAYDKLTEAQKKLVPAETLKKLTDAEAKIAALEKKAKEESEKAAADTASASITSLKAADAITLADKDAVTAARTAYDKLTEAQKKLVPAETLKKLTDAEAKIAALEKAKKESEKAAKAVVKGKTYTVKTLKYKVTRADMKGRGTVTLTGTTKKKTKLTKLTVPKTVKINGAVFKVTAIGNKAFNRFTKIRTVTIGDNVKTIGTSAFAGNTNLAKVMIGKGVTRIGMSAFSGDKKLKTITVRSTKLTSVGKNAIKGIYTKAAIKVPKKQLKKYKKLFSAKTGFKKTMKVKK